MSERVLGAEKGAGFVLECERKRHRRRVGLKNLTSAPSSPPAVARCSTRPCRPPPRHRPLFNLPTIPYPHPPYSHPQNYFNATNALVAKTPALQNKTLAALLSGPAHTGAGVSAADRTTLTNQGGGAYNHGLYFNQLAPTGANMTKTMPADLAKAVDNATIAAWKAAAGSVFGSGWAWLTLAKNGSVIVTTSANQENPLTKGDGIPIAGIDVWEHR